MSWLPHDQYGLVLSTLAALRAGGRAFCWPFELARTQGMLPIFGLRIHGSTRPEGETRGVLIVGGAHAREMVPPEAVLRFADAVCNSYVTGNDFSFGGKAYSGAIATFLVEALDIYLVPLLNPEGRAWVETNDQMWRKNRRPGACRGVDLNRNHDFLFTSGLGTSTNPCNYDVYRGPNAYSEPESAGIRTWLDRKRHIVGVLDVHSYTGLVLYPWGDDENQTTNPAMNFLNSAWDGLRGVRGDAYREHIASADLRFYHQTAARMRDRMFEVGSRTYVAQPAFDLYPTSGTLNDHGYARHFARPSLPRTMSMTVEIGFSADGGFRPAPESTAQLVRNEGAVAILEFCLAIMCAGDAFLPSSARAVRKAKARSLRSFREQIAKNPVGKRYLRTLEVFGGEIIAHVADFELVEEVTDLLDVAIAWSRGEQELDSNVVKRAQGLLSNLRKGSSPGLRKALDAARDDLVRVQGKKPKSAMKVLRGKGLPE